MGMEIHIEAHDEEVKAEFRQAAIAWLHEACGELASAVRNNQRVRTGRTRQSWRWWYADEKGQLHFTRGKRPHRPLYKAYVALKDKIIASAQERFKDMA